MAAFAWTSAENKHPSRFYAVFAPPVSWPSRKREGKERPVGGACRACSRRPWMGWSFAFAKVLDTWPPRSWPANIGAWPLPTYANCPSRVVSLFRRKWCFNYSLNALSLYIYTYYIFISLLFRSRFESRTIPLWLLFIYAFDTFDANADMQN